MLEHSVTELPTFVPHLPERGTVTLVITALSAEAIVDDWLALLSSDERARHERFLIPKIARRFAQCRGTLRRLLAGMLHREPDQIRFDYNALGKPRLADSERCSRLEFNVSHCDDWAVFAFCVESPVGVDVELYQRRANFEAIAGQLLCASELQALDRQPVEMRTHHILKAWVAKESLLKALGVGIGVGLHNVELPLPLDSSCQPLKISAGLLEQIDDDGSCRRTSWIDASAWKLHLLDPIPGAIVAVACHPKIHTIVVKRY